MSRKHVLQKQLQEEVEPPTEGQHIVMAVGSRGSNIIEVQFPDGKHTLCLLPARFHKKLWIKRGNYLIIENIDEVDAAVTGHILHVLFADHVKQLKKLKGVWPPEFDHTNTLETTNDANAAAEELEQLSLSNSNRSAANSQEPLPGGEESKEKEQAAGGEENDESSEESSDDDLPPITRIQNRRIIQYEISESDSDED